jgi:hypothetical protein
MESWFQYNTLNKFKINELDKFPKIDRELYNRAKAKAVETGDVVLGAKLEALDEYYVNHQVFMDAALRCQMAINEIQNSLLDE